MLRSLKVWFSHPDVFLGLTEFSYFQFVNFNWYMVLRGWKHHPVGVGVESAQLVSSVQLQTSISLGKKNRFDINRIISIPSDLCVLFLVSLFIP